MSSIGTVFRERRIEKGLSVREVAEKAGISDTEVFRIESGRRKNPSAHILVSMGKVLGFANDDVLRFAGLKEDDNVSLMEKLFPDLKTEKQQETAQRIMVSIARNNLLQDHDYDDLADQVEMFLNFANKKRNSPKSEV